jgi:hypothetical protein
MKDNLRNQSINKLLRETEGKRGSITEIMEGPSCNYMLLEFFSVKHKREQNVVFSFF